MALNSLGSVSETIFETQAMKTMKNLLTLTVISILSCFCTLANADVIVGAPTADGTTFELSTTNDFYNGSLFRIGGSNNADIAEFVALAYYDISGVTAPAGETFTGAGEVDFGFGNASGVFSGGVEVDLLGQISAIPAQNTATGNNTPEAIANVAVANSAGTNIATLTGLTEADTVNALFSGISFGTGNDIVVFRITDSNPNPTQNQQSNITNFSLTLTTTTAVPEPSSFTLFGFGLAAMFTSRRRKS